MKKKLTALLIVFALSFGGCSWMDGYHVYVVPHHEQPDHIRTGNVSASDYPQLMTVMESLVQEGTESSIIDVADYVHGAVENSIDTVCTYIMEMYPLGAYAVEDIEYEIGSNAGRPAISVTIHYRHSRTEIRQIRKKTDMEAVEETVRAALSDHSSKIVVQVERYAQTDFNEVIREYAQQNPQIVMEVPRISEGIYGEGPGRVIELEFTYRNTRDALKQMQAQVRPVFEAAVLYVSGEGSERQKYAQLCSFLTERFDYDLETSITPSYSLLCHGVGDSRAFAEVYASMCGRSGLICRIVTGTRNGEPWSWNMIRHGDQDYHVDLIRCSIEGGFREYSDEEMNGYVWDYSAYPACTVPFLIEEEPEEEPPELPDYPDEPDPTEPPTTEPEPAVPPATEPQPTEPKPTEPQPTEPKPTEPQPTEPKPTEPQPTEPKPTEPQPTEPKPTEPQPTEPKPTEPQPTEPPETLPTDPPEETKPTQPSETPEETEPTQPTEPAAPPKETVPEQTEGTQPPEEDPASQ